MITDAELTALYGNGLRPDTAARLIDDLRDARARLAEVEVERAGLVRDLNQYADDAHAAEHRLDEVEAERDELDAAASYWYGKWIGASVERDEAIAGRNRWRDSWESGDWSREQWERDRAQESDEARRQDAEHSPDRQHRYWPWGADDTCGAAVQDPGTRSMRACRRPKNDPLHGEDRADV